MQAAPTCGDRGMQASPRQGTPRMEGQQHHSVANAIPFVTCWAQVQILPLAACVSLGRRTSPGLSFLICKVG